MHLSLYAKPPFSDKKSDQRYIFGQFNLSIKEESA